jgi:hypothetical protein
MLSLILLEIPNGSAGNSMLPWWQVVTGIIGIPAAIIGLISAYRISKKTQLETQKLQLEIIEAERKLLPEQTQQLSYQEELLRSPQAIAINIQDFVIRFIIFSLALAVWGIISEFILPSFWLVINLQHENARLSYTIYQVSALFGGYLVTIGRLIIFVVLGWPLLRDICRTIGIRPQDLWKGFKPRGSGSA